jgi:hypothetical protein
MQLEHHFTKISKLNKLNIRIPMVQHPKKILVITFQQQTE